MDRQSLAKQHSHRVDVPIMIVAAMGLLIAGLLEPTLEMTKAIFFTDTYSIWIGIYELWKSDHYFLAALIFFFSMVFPVFKLLTLSVIWLAPMHQAVRQRWIGALAVLGKWSMLDVYVVAVLIVLIKARDIIDANAKIGIYLFAGAILLSIIATHAVERAARAEPVNR